MTLERLIQTPITGIQACNELPVDAEIWNESNLTHVLHRRLHLLAGHRPGIVTGLEVIASADGKRVVVAPGVAIDRNGQTVVLNDHVSIQLKKNGFQYIGIEFVATLDDSPAVDVGGVSQGYRMRERSVVEASSSPLADPKIELARIERSSVAAPISNSQHALEPALDEIDLMFRNPAFPVCYSDIAVGELICRPLTESGSRHSRRAGLWNLLNEGRSQGFALAIANPLEMAKPPSADQEPTLLYLAGRQGFQPFSEEQAKRLKTFLDTGGTLFAEAAGTHDSDDFSEFARTFKELTLQLGAEMKPVEAGDPLLNSHFRFPGLPPGGETGLVFADHSLGLLFSACDYGAAWAGQVQKPEAPDARERVRQSIEFGLNLVAYAAKRSRNIYLRKLSEA